MSKTEETKAPKALNEEILRIEGIIQDKITIDGKTGDITADAETPLYEAALPEELSVKTVKQVHKYDRNFVTAVTLVAGKLSLKSFQENKDLQQTQLSVPLEGRSSVNAKFTRRKEFTNHIGQQHAENGKETSTDPVVHFCHAQVKVKTSMGSGFNSVKTLLAEQGKEFLSK